MTHITLFQETCDATLDVAWPVLLRAGCPNRQFAQNIFPMPVNSSVGFGTKAMSKNNHLTISFTIAITAMQQKFLDRNRSDAATKKAPAEAGAFSNRKAGAYRSRLWP